MTSDPTSCSLPRPTAPPLGIAPPTFCQLSRLFLFFYLKVQSPEWMFGFGPDVLGGSNTEKTPGTSPVKIKDENIGR